MCGDRARPRARATCRCTGSGRRRGHRRVDRTPARRYSGRQRTAQEPAPDIALLAAQVPGRAGLTLAADLRSALPDCRTIIRTAFSRPGHLARAMSAGRGRTRRDGPPPEQLAAPPRGRDRPPPPRRLQTTHHSVSHHPVPLVIGVQMITEVVGRVQPIRINRVGHHPIQINNPIELPRTTNPLVDLVTDLRRPLPPVIRPPNGNKVAPITVSSWAWRINSRYPAMTSPAETTGAGLYVGCASVSLNPMSFSPNNTTTVSTPAS